MMAWIRGFAIGAAALAASACSHMPEIGSVLPGEMDAISADASPRARVRTAVTLLGEGHERRARAELDAALRQQPDLASARRLLQQIEEEPASLLAGAPQDYTVRQGETMSQLAERFQGDSLLFYALARYNGIDAPNQLTEGQVLRIPRRPGVRVSVTAAALAPNAPSSAPPSATAPQERAIASTSAARSQEAQRANQLRLRGLQYLNAGEVERAVATLRQAQALDATNGAIRRDLDRATRLQATLRSGNTNR